MCASSFRLYCALVTAFHRLALFPRSISGSSLRLRKNAGHPSEQKKPIPRSLSFLSSNKRTSNRNRPHQDKPRGRALLEHKENIKGPLDDVARFFGLHGGEDENFKRKPWKVSQIAWGEPGDATCPPGSEPLDERSCGDAVYLMLDHLQLSHQRWPVISSRDFVGRGPDSAGYWRGELGWENRCAGDGERRCGVHNKNLPFYGEKLWGFHNLPVGCSVQSTGRDPEVDVPGTHVCGPLDHQWRMPHYRDPSYRVPPDWYQVPEEEMHLDSEMLLQFQGVRRESDACREWRSAYIPVCRRLEDINDSVSEDEIADLPASWTTPPVAPQTIDELAWGEPGDADCPQGSHPLEESSCAVAVALLREYHDWTTNIPGRVPAGYTATPRFHTTSDLTWPELSKEASINNQQDGRYNFNGTSCSNVTAGFNAFILPHLGIEFALSDSEIARVINSACPVNVNVPFNPGSTLIVSLPESLSKLPNPHELYDMYRARHKNWTNAEPWMKLADATTGWQKQWDWYNVPLGCSIQSSGREVEQQTPDSHPCGASFTPNREAHWRDGEVPSDWHEPNGACRAWRSIYMPVCRRDRPDSWTPPEKPAAVTCPRGSRLLDYKGTVRGADIVGCGIEDCDARTLSSQAATTQDCYNLCRRMQPLCQAFEWADVGWSEKTPNRTNCELHGEAEPNGLQHGVDGHFHQIVCGLEEVQSPQVVPKGPEVLGTIAADAAATDGARVPASEVARDRTAAAVAEQEPNSPASSEPPPYVHPTWPPTAVVPSAKPKGPSSDYGLQLTAKQQGSATNSTSTSARTAREASTSHNHTIIFTDDHTLHAHTSEAIEAATEPPENEKSTNASVKGQETEDAAQRGGVIMQSSRTSGTAAAGARNSTGEVSGRLPEGAIKSQSEELDTPDQDAVPAAAGRVATICGCSATFVFATSLLSVIILCLGVAFCFVFLSKQDMATELQDQRARHFANQFDYDPQRQFDKFGDSNAALQGRSLNSYDVSVAAAGPSGVARSAIATGVEVPPSHLNSPGSIYPDFMAQPGSTTADMTSKRKSSSPGRDLPPAASGLAATSRTSEGPVHTTLMVPAPPVPQSTKTGLLVPSADFGSGESQGNANADSLDEDVEAADRRRAGENGSSEESVSDEDF
ncbi:unnamed protein product [Amoebophrya sp. A120]|nr:unnamed protein product [Amoebophrya sp. A120]|eukprot:GSA120T00018885001.1